MGLFGSSSTSDPQVEVDLNHLRDRVARLEAQVAQLLAGAPAADSGAPGDAAPAPAYLDEVRALKAQGKVIHAIKVYREATGAGLREAKEHVERMV
jgi:large subunit ribosomal protein L7/L12